MASGVKLAPLAAAFACGVAISTSACLAALRLHEAEREKHGKKEKERERDSEAQRLIKLYGLPLTGAETRSYTNHILSYDQSRRTPKWVAEHLSKEKLLGKADRKHCKFRPDPSIPELFTAHNEDYLGSGWSRGHMAPAGDNKYSEQSMAETFYLSNIVPQNYENNAGFWNRLEMYCRELTERFSDVWVISGPLNLPQIGENGKKSVSYQLIGKDDVAVPSHLYKVILVRQNSSSELLALAAFVVPNSPVGFEHPLKEYRVSLEELEKISGLTFFPKLAGAQSLKDLCLVDSCELMDFKRFTLFIAGRKVKGCRTLAKLEKVELELKEAGITPDDYFTELYLEKKQELLEKESTDKKTSE